MSHHLHISLLGNEISREGLKQLMGERGFRVATWPLHQFRHCIDRTPDTSAQLIVVDPTNRETGITICKSIRKSLPDVAIIMLHDNDIAEPAGEALTDTVDYEIARSSSLDTLWGIVDLIARKADKAGIAVEEEAPLEPYRLLSMREIEILHCLATGQTNKLIARRLNISEATVKVHVKTMLRKLSLANRTQAAIWALQHHLISLENASAWVASPNGRAVAEDNV